MNRTITPRPSKRAPTGALILFALAYIGVLAIVFAPHGSLSDRNAMATTEQGQ
jgi:hypothetical protein